MLDATHPITAFFDDDPARVLASLPAIAASSGQVSSLDTLFRKPGEAGLRGHRDGLFAAKIFGPEPDRFGHIETAGVVHPSVFPRLVKILQIDTPHLVAVARGEKLLRDGKIIDELLPLEEGDLTGPRGLAEAVRRLAPDHPLLPLCTITKIPVPPNWSAWGERRLFACKIFYVTGRQPRFAAAGFGTPSVPTTWTETASSWRAASA